MRLFQPIQCLPGIYEADRGVCQMDVSHVLLLSGIDKVLKETFRGFSLTSPCVNLAERSCVQNLAR